MANEIKCPKCGAAITIDEAIVQKMVNLRVQKTLAEEKGHLQTELKQELEKQQSENLKSIQQKLEQSRQKELESIKKQSDLEDKLKSQELETARKFQIEKNKISEQVHKDAEQLWQMKVAEKEKMLEDQKKLISEMQRKAHQGSMQTQGEVLELSLEESLKHNFPMDKIAPVPKGISGADIIQTVYHQSGQPAGTIVWESKHTKNWTEEWVQKLKDDSRNIKGDISVLVSEILPKNINHVGQYNGIWVCDFPSFIGLTTALRHQLLAVFNTLTASTGKEEKMEILYNYLCSPTFSQRVEAIVEAFINMKSSLDKEKIAMTKIWASREMQINRLTDNTTKMYGEIQGIAGSSLPPIELLELESGDDSTESS